MDTKPIAEARREANLNKKFRWPDGVVESLRDRVTTMVATGQARITFTCGTGKKRDGLRLPTKPQWVLWVGDLGVDISKIAAALAASLMQSPPDLADLEARGLAEYVQGMMK